MHPSRVLLAAAVLAAGPLGGCGTAAYYGQALSGQLEVLASRRPIGAVLDDPATPAPLRERLEQVQALRRFAVEALALADKGSFTTFAALGRRYVLWNVFATPELSLQPRRWCYPVAGCFHYRGYFAQTRARALAERLAAAGHDVYVGGVSAYSTLGWFADPVLDTMLHGDAVQLARVIFHELAHERLYFSGDTDFNEAFATAVAEVGVQRWAAQLPPPQADEARIAGARDRAFMALVLATRDELAALYASDLDAQAMRQGKAAHLAALVRRYERWKSRWNGYTGYDAWVYTDLNNAKLAAVASYHALVPAFEALLERLDAQLPRLYTTLESLRALSPHERHACLAALAQGSARLPPGDGPPAGC